MRQKFVEEFWNNVIKDLLFKDKDKEKTCKLVLNLNPQGQQHWAKNGLLTFFTVTSCMVVVTDGIYEPRDNTQQIVCRMQNHWQFFKTLWSKDKDLWSKYKEKDL